MPLSAPKTWTSSGKTAGPVQATEFDALVGTAPTTISVVEVPAGGGEFWLDFSTVTASQSGMVSHRTSYTTPYLQLSYHLTFLSVATVAAEASQLRSGANPDSTVKRGSVLHNIAAGSNTVQVRGHNGTTDVLLDGTVPAGTNNPPTLPVWAAGTPVAVETKCLVQIAAERGASTTTGKMKARLTRVSDGVVLAEGEDWALDAGALNVPWSHHQTGDVAASSAAPFRITNIAFSDQAYEYLPAASSAPPPTATTTQDGLRRIRVTPAGTGPFTLSNVARVSGAAVAGLTATGMDITFVEDPARTTAVVIGFTVTGAGGSTAVQVTVPPPTTAAAPSGAVVRRYCTGTAWD